MANFARYFSINLRQQRANKKLAIYTNKLTNKGSLLCEYMNNQNSPKEKILCKNKKLKS